ncbi:sensor histidine kinase [Leptospira stimsonii]|uniref:histidine kinase n=1 Tax=Leptospira stimsonii TaxID=2202203 RepID=A0ABY2N5A9_9LEPT|nr:7TM diverse intracellular signaling domain-containing protein [Leptospira stimsonii]TGK19653.1 histidine kinase [Leptospira stimsonii]TGM17165.1 histidine kinase [Leptospira stimsonii]
MKQIVYSIFIIFLILTIRCSPAISSKERPKAQKGTIDLRNFNLNEENTTLDGDWEFYWNELPQSNRSLSSNPLYERVPGIWRDYDPSYTWKGYATYRLHVLCDWNRPNLKIRIPRLPGVYDVYFDDHKVYSNGLTGTDAIDTVFLAHPLITNVVVPSGDFWITVVVSNFKGNHLKGGIRNSFRIGNGNSIDLEERKEEWMEIILISVICAFGIYHIVFFFAYRKDPVPLHFAAFCFLVSLYTFITSGIQYMALPSLSLDLRIRIEFFCEVTFFPTVYLILRRMFPLEFETKWIRFAIASTILFSIGILTLDENNLVRLYSVFLYAPPIYAVFILVPTIAAFRNKEPRAKTILITGLVLVFTMLNDVFYGLFEVYVLFPYSFPLGLVTFVALNSYIISSRFTEDLEKAKEFAQLQIKYNEQLKLQAEERTRIASDIHDTIGSELTAILFELESKNKEDSTLKKLKTEMTQLISNVRDIVFLMHHTGTHKELVEEVMTRYAERIQGTGSIRVKTEIKEVSDVLRLDQCLHVQKIFLELMSNILRHSEAKNIQILWNKDGKHLRLRIVDDGKKFETKSDEMTGIGLNNIQMRAEKLSASYDFSRESENIFSMNIPIF